MQARETPQVVNLCQWAAPVVEGEPTPTICPAFRSCAMANVHVCTDTHTKQINVKNRNKTMGISRKLTHLDRVGVVRQIGTFQGPEWVLWFKVSVKLTRL